MNQHMHTKTLSLPLIVERDTDGKDVHAADLTNGELTRVLDFTFGANLGGYTEVSFMHSSLSKFCD